MKTKNFLADRDFIMCAVALNLESFMKTKFPNYFDSFGYAHYYDLVVDIVDEMLGNRIDIVDCIDWHYTDLACTLVTDERIERVAGWKK